MHTFKSTGVWIILCLSSIGIVSSSAADSTATAISNSDTAVQQAPGVRKGGNAIVIKETRDTVYVVDASSVREPAGDVRDKVDHFHEKGFGVCGGPLYGLYAVNINPVKRLCEKDPFLAGKTFHFSHTSYEPFGGVGGMGCIGIGNGFRIGGGGMHARKSFISELFSGDSILSITVHVGYGGFIVAKAAKLRKWNIKGGGIIGGGTMDIKAAYGKSGSAFEGDEDEDLKATAHFFSLCPYYGISYSFFRIFHIGADVSLPIFISVDGFSPWVPDFYTVNPGISLKIIFGNLG